MTLADFYDRIKVYDKDQVMHVALLMGAVEEAAGAAKTTEVMAFLAAVDEDWQELIYKYPAWYCRLHHIDASKPELPVDAYEGLWARFDLICILEDKGPEWLAAGRVPVKKGGDSGINGPGW